MTQETAWSSTVPKLPHFPVHLRLPDLTPWLAGNAGLPGVWHFTAGAPGPHVVITALIHGNEIAGALALDHLLRTHPTPLRGSFTLIFANLDAVARFDPENPTASRFADEDMNRLWDAAVLDSNRDSRELARARALRPLIDSADILLDLHSMLWPSDPLILCGPTEKGRDLAMDIGVPPLVVADHGHLGGRRLIDYAPFTDPATPRAAILVEAGQHWEPATVTTMLKSVNGLLAIAGLAPARPPPRRPAPKPRLAEVTVAVTATSGAFTFAAAYRGGDIIERRNTLIAMDGANEIRTPHDNCLLVMPSLRPSRGHTAVRLARFVV